MPAPPAIGQRLIPRLVQAGHVVGGLTRSPSKTELLSHLGAEPILCDVFKQEALIQAVRDFKPDVVLNELTDLPEYPARNENFGRRTRLYDPRPEGMKPVSLLKLALNVDQSALINLTFDPAKEGAGISEQGSVLCEASVLRYERLFRCPGSYLDKLALSGLDRHSMIFDQLTQMRTDVLWLQLRCVDFSNALPGRQLHVHDR